MIYFLLMMKLLLKLFYLAKKRKNGPKGAYLAIVYDKRNNSNITEERAIYFWFLFGVKDVVYVSLL